MCEPVSCVKKAPKLRPTKQCHTPAYFGFGFSLKYLRIPAAISCSADVPLERVRHAAALDPEACRFGVTVEGVVWELRAESEAAMGAWLRALSR